MGQTTSQPLQRPPAVPHTSLSTAYESAPEYIDELSFDLYNLPVVDGIPVKTIPSAYKYNPDHKHIHHQSSSTTSSSASTSRTITTYKPTPQFLKEASQQYVASHGIFYSLATHKLRRSFLHPADLTESEFLSLVCADDIDAWIKSQRPKLIHRTISRLAQARRELKEAGIPYSQLQGTEMFELMNAEERRRFIEEYKTQQKQMADELQDTMGEEVVAGPSRWHNSETTNVAEEIKMRESEMMRSGDTKLSGWTFEEKNKSLERRRSAFGSLRGVFKSHSRQERSECSEASYPSLEMRLGRRHRRLSDSLRRSVHSIRHMFGYKHRAFKRAGISEIVYTE